MDEQVDGVRAIMANPRFQALVRARSTLGWSLTAVMFVVYFGFILLVAFNKNDGAILSTKVGDGPTTIAIVAGTGILFFTFLINAFYVIVANTKFDRMSRELREEIGQ